MPKCDIFGQKYRKFGSKEQYWRSITDICLYWEETQELHNSKQKKNCLLYNSVLHIEKDALCPKNQ